ncbi:myb/SANT-like DNA-binding domain-containing protein 4 [Ostrinia nubilalis]|uniref:myb/SANT-like DNA-binding domain-containing protein 4 n=1 Tax=Ostrinia nubilalis TaxID=29057 RepID=UPI0030824EF8
MPITRSKGKAAGVAVAPATIPATTEAEISEDGASSVVPETAGPSTTPSPASITSVPKSARSNRSTSTMKARILTAKAEHARRLAQLDAERERAQLERERAQLERERAQLERERERECDIANLELQAELAAIAASSSQRSLSNSRSSVERWLAQSTIRDTDYNANALLDREPFPNVKPQPPPRPAPPATADGAA